MMREDELLYKINVIIKYLKEHNGYNYKLYNHLCPDNDVEPDSNIVEYALDVLDKVKEMFKVENNYKYEKDYYLVALKRVIGSRDKVFEEVIEEVHFLKDIYTEEEIHSKLIEEIDKNANIKM